MAAEHAPRKTASQGFTLIEALIALVLLCVGVLGVAAMHGRAVQYAVDAEDRNRAATLANEMASLMWASRTTNKNELPTGALTAWQTRVASPTASGLPNATGTVDEIDANKSVLITITWRPPHRPRKPTPETPKTPYNELLYSTRVALP